MKFGLICPQVPGHLNPITALARHLQMRCHEVVFLYSSGAGGLPFIPGEEEWVISERRAELSKQHGEEAFKFAMSLMMSQSEAIIKSLPSIVQSNQIDALVIDQGKCLGRTSCNPVGHSLHTRVRRDAF